MEAGKVGLTEEIHGLWNPSAWALPLPSCMTLGKLLSLSGPLFPFLCSEAQQLIQPSILESWFSLVFQDCRVGKRSHGVILDRLKSGRHKISLAWLANPMGYSLCLGSVSLEGDGGNVKNQRMLSMNQVGPRSQEEGGGCGRGEQVHF